MNYTSTRYTRWLSVVIVFLLHQHSVFGQLSGINYSYPAVAAPGMTFNNSSAGSTTLIAGGTDDALVTYAAPVGWGGFYYGSVWYPQATTTFYVSSNGWVSVSKTGDPVPPSSLPVNSQIGRAHV